MTEDPEANEREFTEACKRLYAEMTKPRTAAELLAERDRRMREKPAQIPEYGRE